MKKLKGIGVAFILLLSILMPALNQSVSAAAAPRIDHTSPAANEQNVPIDTDIRIYFNSDIRGISSQYIKLFEKSNGTYYDFPIKTVKKDGEALHILPEKSLGFNKEYMVQFNGPAVDLQNGSYNQHLSYTFQTNYIDFYELMVVNEGRLMNMLDTYAPRQIKAFAPKRYINEISVIHKKTGSLKGDQASFNGITNIDINTKSEDVASVHVDIMKNDNILQKGYASKVTGTKASKNQFTFDIGFSNIPDFYDVRVTVLNNAQQTIDSKIIKFAAEDGKAITSFKESYKYKTAGNGYTFHELLSKESLFADLLSESLMQDIKVQVEDR
ncbi:Ig-like domain-containing protein [Cytobacillus praedii]|uniref:Ig-like domain-containing protein n=1 Tax=Cytobacillus praedii TaxID=1742358 RepID=UPI003F7E3D3C